MHIGAEREHEKKAAEQILSLGNPCDRFNPHWMNRKNGSHERARPDPPRHRAQNKEKQYRSDVVQNNVREMVTARLEPINLAVRHVAESCKRMPKIRVAVR